MNPTLHSQIIGKGKPFVILHGFLGMSDNWKTLGRKFSEFGYEVHLVDQRNHGRSFHSEAFSYQLMAQDLKDYCAHHHLTNIVLLGHSMGGKTAMNFAVNNSKMVDHLIIADIAPKSYPQHHNEILKALGSLDFSTLSSRNEADETLAIYIKERGIRQFLLKNLYWKEKGQLGLRVNLRAVTKHVSNVGEALDPHARFNKNTLFVRGSKSGYIESIDQITIHKHFPKAEIKTIEGAGHWLHAENPTVFLEIIMKFVQKEVKFL